jgi:hypothetical protein
LQQSRTVVYIVSCGLSFIIHPSRHEERTGSETRDQSWVAAVKTRRLTDEYRERCRYRLNFTDNIFLYGHRMHLFVLRVWL